jgi:hypothetical protein
MMRRLSTSLPWLVLSALALSACARKAPGPAQCQRVALRLLGVTDARALRIPEVKRRFDEITVQCLVTPYDRQFVRCLEETGQSRACLFEFKRRKQGGDSIERFPVL